MQHIKDIDIMENIYLYLEKTGGAQAVTEFKRANTFLTDSSFLELNQTLDFEILVNDRMDMLVRIKNQPNLDFKTDEEEQTSFDNTIYYYESADFS